MVFPSITRPVTDFNQITLHFLECIHVHLDNTRPKVMAHLKSIFFFSAIMWNHGLTYPWNMKTRCSFTYLHNIFCSFQVNVAGGTVTPVRNDVKGYQAPTFNQVRLRPFSWLAKVLMIIIWKWFVCPHLDCRFLLSSSHLILALLVQTMTSTSWFSIFSRNHLACK